MLPEPAALALPQGDDARAMPGPWRTALGLLGLASAALILLAAREWAEMLHQWWNIDTYNHLLLMPPILVCLSFTKTGSTAPRWTRIWQCRICSRCFRNWTGCWPVLSKSARLPCCRNGSRDGGRDQGARHFPCAIRRR